MTTLGALLVGLLLLLVLLGVLVWMQRRPRRGPEQPRTVADLVRMRESAHPVADTAEPAEAAPSEAAEPDPVDAPTPAAVAPSSDDAQPPAAEEVAEPVRARARPGAPFASVSGAPDDTTVDAPWARAARMVEPWPEPGTQAAEEPRPATDDAPTESPRRLALVPAAGVDARRKARSARGARPQAVWRRVPVEEAGPADAAERPEGRSAEVAGERTPPPPSSAQRPVAMVEAPAEPLVASPGARSAGPPAGSADAVATPPVAPPDPLGLVSAGPAAASAGGSVDSSTAMAEAPADSPVAPAEAPAPGDFSVPSAEAPADQAPATGDSSVPSAEAPSDQAPAPGDSSVPSAEAPADQPTALAVAPADPAEVSAATPDDPSTVVTEAPSDAARAVAEAPAASVYPRGENAALPTDGVAPSAAVIVPGDAPVQVAVGLPDGDTARADARAEPPATPSTNGHGPVPTPARVAGRVRRRPSATPAEQAAADLALLRTFGVAHRNSVDEPDVALEGCATDDDAPAAGNAQPVSFHVLDRDGSGIRGATVTLLDDHGRETASTHTNSDGRGALTARRPGGYMLVIAADGYQPGAITVAVTDEPVDADIPLTRSASIAGSVGGEDGPIVGAQLALVQDGEVVDTTESHTDGAYRFADLAAGEYGLSVTAHECEPAVFVLGLADEAHLRQDVELVPVGLPSDDVMSAPR